MSTGQREKSEHDCTLLSEILPQKNKYIYFYLKGFDVKKYSNSELYNVFPLIIYLYSEDEILGCRVTQGPGSKKYLLRDRLFQNSSTGVVREVLATDSPSCIDHTWPGRVPQEHFV